MSNQRRGKTHKAALGDGLQDMKLKLFFQDCAEVLEDSGNEDAAFYFHQLVEHLMEGKPIPNDNKREAARILGL
jgi:hypothetical protein